MVSDWTNCRVDKSTGVMLTTSAFTIDIPILDLRSVV